jgi:hypothetical protein
MGTCLLSPCLAANGRIHLTELLPCNYRRDINTDTKTDERHCSDGLSFINTVSAIHKLIGEDSQTHRMVIALCPQQNCIFLGSINCINCHERILHSELLDFWTVSFRIYILHGVNIIFSSESYAPATRYFS